MTKFGIKPVDRTKHMYIIGKTGTGKSTFLENMIVQDIQNGNGLAFIDPHGGSAEKLLDYIPEHRIKDVIYFNPSDTEFPIAFNPMEDVGANRRHLVADGLMSVFEKIWPEAFSGRMTYILNNTMLALLESPEPNLLGINRMLTDKDFRKRVVANITDPTVKNAWEELLKWDDKTWRDAIAALVNKVGQFTTNPILRNIIGQTKSTFDFRKAMDEKKIIIINLSKGMIGEQNAPLIGAMLITKIYLAAMSRAELSSAEIQHSAPFYFYVDEFQNFANDSFASILSEARKYKLALTVANQYIAQMEETIRDAVFGNMGTTVAFRVGPLDAEFIEKIFTPTFTAEDLQNIAFGQMYLTLQIDGMGSKPFSAQGLGPIPPLEHSFRREVIAASRAQFARPKAEVDQMVVEYFGYNTKPDKDRISATPVGSTTHTPAKTPVQKFTKPSSGSRTSEKAVTKSAVPVHVSEPAPVKLSPKMTDLLDQLDTVADSAVIVPREKSSPKTGAPVGSSADIPTASPVLPKKNKDRAAGGESKNLLLEALQKAEQLKKKEIKPVEPVASDPVALNQAIQGALADVSSKETKGSVPEKVVADTPQTPHPVREVPEDILKKILE